MRRQESVSGIRAVSATQWDVELREAVERFGEALSSVGGSVLHSVSNFYRIEMSASEVPASLRIFEAAQASGAQIRSLRAAQRSLEEAFMEAIQ